MVINETQSTINKTYTFNTAGKYVEEDIVLNVQFTGDTGGGGVPEGTYYPYGEEITLSGNTPCFGYVTSSQKDWICLVPMPQRLYGMEYVRGTLSYTLRGGDTNTQSGTASTSQTTYSTWGDCLYLRINKNVSFGTNNTAIGGYISGITIKLTPPPTE